MRPSLSIWNHTTSRREAGAAFARKGVAFARKGAAFIKQGGALIKQGAASSAPTETRGIIRLKSLSAFCLLLGTSVLLLTGCKPPTVPPAAAPPVTVPTPTANPGGFPLTLSDSRGKTLTLTAAPQHIISLTPSNTEILYEIGAGTQITADTTACDFPPEAKTIPHIDALSPSIEAIEAKSPDLVIALDTINGKMIEMLDKAGVPVLVVRAKTLDQTYEAITLIGTATGHLSQAEQTVKAMKDRIALVIQKLASSQSSSQDGQTGKSAPSRVFVMYGDSPIYTTGPESYISDLIKIAGGVNVVIEPLAGDVISPEKVVELEPDVIICSPELQKKAQQMPGWAMGVPAVRNNRFFVTSPGATLERPGPRLAAAAEELARFLHPEAFAATDTISAGSHSASSNPSSSDPSSVPSGTIAPGQSSSLPGSPSSPAPTGKP